MIRIEKIEAGTIVSSLAAIYDGRRQEVFDLLAQLAVQSSLKNG